jgi:hypothetical protein
LVGAVSAAVFFGCSAERADVPESTHSDSRRFVMPAGGALNWVVVVDDRDDPDAARLRSDVKAAFAAYVDGILGEHAQSPNSDRWLSVDIGAIVVHPSRAGDDQWTGPDDEPALRWTTSQADAAGARIFADAFARAVDEGGPAPPGSRYQPLDAYRRVMRLRSRCAEPRGRREQVLAETLGIDVDVIVSAADDEGTEPAPAYAEAVKTCDVFAPEVFVPGVSLEDGGTCGPRASRFWRLAVWKPWEFDSLERTCDTAGKLTDVFGARLSVDYAGSLCPSKPVALNPDGTAACTLRVLHTQFVGCPAARGWFDPSTGDGGTGATYVGAKGSERRVCEVRQLDGEAGATCRLGTACPDCPSGFCMRTGDSAKWCPYGTGFRADLHVTGGALTGPLEGRLTCLLEP